jgi:hypothetical protein
MPIPGYSHVDVTIAVAASKSGFAEINGYEVVGVLVPANTEGAYVRFYVDTRGNDATGVLAYNMAGQELRATYGTLPSVISIPNFEGTNIGPIPACARIAVESATGGSATNQSGANAVITLLLRQIGPSL